MKKGKCPKCGSSYILALNVPNVASTMNGNIMMEFVKLGTFKSARLQHYICQKCGYLEHYIVDSDIEKLS